MTRDNARRAEVTVALGHAPTTVNDVTYHYSVDPVAAYELIQYDQIFINISQNLGINGRALQLHRHHEAMASLFSQLLSTRYVLRERLVSSKKPVSNRPITHAEGSIFEATSNPSRSLTV